VFVDAADKIVCDPDIKRATNTTGQDVDQIASADANFGDAWGWRCLGLLYRPVKPGDDRFACGATAHGLAPPGDNIGFMCVVAKIRYSSKVQSITAPHRAAYDAVR
jgi:hypothetical protein